MNHHHWLRAFLTLLVTCVAVVVLSTSSFAGDGERGKGHRCPAYGDLDADGDGSVTGEEFYAFRAERRAARAADGGKMKKLTMSELKKIL